MGRTGSPWMLVATADAGQSTLAPPRGTLAVTSTISGTRAITLGANGGAFNISSGQTVTEAAIGVSGNGGPLGLTGAGTLILGATTNTVGSLTGTGPLSMGADNLTLGLDGSTQSYSGTITGTGGVTMAAGT